MSAQGGCVFQHAIGQTPPVNSITDRFKKNTLSQTSFVGGKNELQVVYQRFISDQTVGVNPSGSGVHFNSEVQCIISNGYMGTYLHVDRIQDRQTHIKTLLSHKFVGGGYIRNLAKN